MKRLLLPFKIVDKLSAGVLICVIKVYQKTLSLDHGPLSRLHPHGYCRFYPTCSEYGVQALQKKGTVRGVPLIVWRVLRCNPWSEGGIDYVPEK